MTSCIVSIQLRGWRYSSYQVLIVGEQGTAKARGECPPGAVQRRFRQAEWLELFLKDIPKELHDVPWKGFLCLPSAPTPANRRVQSAVYPFNPRVHGRCSVCERNYAELRLLFVFTPSSHCDICGYVVTNLHIPGRTVIGFHPLEYQAPVQYVVGNFIH